MTRKDFKLIAKILNKHLQIADTSGIDSNALTDYAIIQDITRALDENYERFDKKRFVSVVMEGIINKSLCSGLLR